MAGETAAPACPGGRATQCGITDLAVRAGGIALPARPGPMDWPDTASRALCRLAGGWASSCGCGGVPPGLAVTGEARSAAGPRRAPGRGFPRPPAVLRAPPPHLPPPPPPPPPPPDQQPIL